MLTRGAAAGALVALALGLLARSGAAGPALGLLRGPLAWALALATAVQVLGRRAGPALERALARRPGLIALAAFVVFAAVGRHYSARLHPSGDEPHYLLMAQSLAREGDLDLRDNFERGDFLEYAPDLAAPHYGAPRADGRPFPAHSPGLPLLLAPAYALGGRTACVVLMALLTALTVAQVAPLARGLGASETAAAFAALAACGPPLFFYSFHVYTEVPSALALAGALRLLLRDGAPAARRTAWAAAGAALLASTLPWLHVKMVLAAAVLGVIALARLRGRARLAFVAVAGLMAAGFLGYYASVFGRATPLALYGGGLPRGVEPAPLRAGVGLLLDRSFGLLPHAPVFLLALAGLPRLLARAARRHPAALAHTLVAAAVLVPVLAWRMWWGGQCAPARFLVPIVPLLAAAAALRLSLGDRDGIAARGLAGLRFTLLALGAALAAFMVARPADLLLLNRRDRPTRVWEALAGSTPAGPVSLGDYLPSLVLPSDAETARAALWLAGVVALLAWDAWRARRAS